MSSSRGRLTTVGAMAAAGLLVVGCGGGPTGTDGGGGGGGGGSQGNSPPSASISSPSDGATFARGAPVAFEGSATDAEDGEITGLSLSWRSDADGQLGSGTSVTESDLSVGDHTVTLTATDSEGATGSASVSLTIEQNGLPSATIDQPSSGASFEEGTSVTFQGSGSDPEDGTLTGSSLEWSSSVDGQLGTGETLTRDDLSAGSHSITLTVTDSRDAVATATVSIAVEGDPSVSIDQPGDQSIFQEGDAVTFQGSATDPTDGALTGSSLEWSSDVDGQLGTGESVSTSGLSPGPHAITLTATDSDGNTASGSIDLVVESPGFDIRIRFIDSFTQEQITTVEAGRDPWTSVITGDLAAGFLLPADSVPADPRFDDIRECLKAEDSGGVDDLVVCAFIQDIDDTGGVLARAGPFLLRDGNGLPVAGRMLVDRADLDNPDLEQIVTHELGHALGIGIGGAGNWGADRDLSDPRDPFFSGSNTLGAFDGLGGEAYLSDGVPLANTGGAGTAGGHWREANFTVELMTGFINAGVDMPISTVTVAALDDIGYTVDLGAADAFSLPMPQPALWEAEADATLSRPASSGQNLGGPPGTSSLDSAIVAGANNGTWTADPDGERLRGLLRFGVPSLPSGVSVTGAALELTVHRRDTETTGHDIEVVPVTSSWSEDMVTWDSRPGFGSSAVLSFVNDAPATDLASLTSASFLDLVRDWADGSRANDGIAFRAPDAGSDPTFSIGFVTRHLGPMTQPRIVVEAQTGGALRAARRGPVRRGELIDLRDDIWRGPVIFLRPDGAVQRVERP